MRDTANGDCGAQRNGERDLKQIPVIGLFLYDQNLRGGVGVDNIFIKPLQCMFFSF